MASPEKKPKSPPQSPDETATTDAATQSDADAADTMPTAQALSPTAPLTHEQRRRLRHKLIRKYHC